MEPGCLLTSIVAAASIPCALWVKIVNSAKLNVSGLAVVHAECAPVFHDIRSSTRPHYICFVHTWRQIPLLEPFFQDSEQAQFFFACYQLLPLAASCESCSKQGQPVHIHQAVPPSSWFWKHHFWQFICLWTENASTSVEITVISSRSHDTSTRQRKRCCSFAE